MTASASFALAIAALVAGVVLGLVLARIRRAPAEHTAGPTAAELLQRLVRSSNNAVLVLNEFGDQVLYNPRAAELGLVHDHQADTRASEAAKEVLSTGSATQVDLSPHQAKGRGPTAVLGDVRPLGDGFTVVEAVDHSDSVRLEQTRRDFVANVSHELKTPVGAISLLAEAMADAADDSDEVLRFSEKIRGESTRLGTLVTELIALSRLQGAEGLPELDVVRVDDVVSDALERSELAAQSADTAMTADAPSGLFVLGDATLLVTALSNLLSNAIAYSPEGSAVSVSRRLVGRNVEIAVTDRGIGIPTDAQERVFERFYRVDRARSRATGGTGLGLAIVKHVAANHGGDVRLWSRPGVGSTFTLRIPAHVDDGTTPDSENSDPSSSEHVDSSAVPGAGGRPTADLADQGGRT